MSDAGRYVCQVKENTHHKENFKKVLNRQCKAKALFPSDGQLLKSDQPCWQAENRAGFSATATATVKL